MDGRKAPRDWTHSSLISSSFHASRISSFNKPRIPHPIAFSSILFVTMEKANDLESQIPVPEVQEAPKERNVFHVILASIKKVLDIVFGRKLTKRHVSLLIYLVWFFCYSTYVFMAFFGTHVFYKELKYSSSLTATMKRDVIAMERVIGNSTEKLSSYLLDEWPEGTYTVGYSEICRKNIDSKEVCYKGNKVEELILQDIGIQIAENQNMENATQFGKHFMTHYRALQDDSVRELNRRTSCNSLVCHYEGLTTKDVAQFPDTNTPDYLWFNLIWANLVFATLAVFMIIIKLRFHVPGFNFVIYVCGLIQVCISSFTVGLFGTTVALLKTYFTIQYYAFNISIYAVHIAMALMLTISSAICLCLQAPE